MSGDRAEIVTARVAQMLGQQLLRIVELETENEQLRTLLAEARTKENEHTDETESRQ